MNHQQRIEKALKTGVPGNFAEMWIAKFELEHPQETRQQAETLWFALKRAMDIAIAGNHTVADLATDESDEFSVAVDIIAAYWGPVVVHRSKDQFRDRVFDKVLVFTPAGEKVECWVDQHGELKLFAEDM